MLWVFDEISYDKQLDNYDRLYKVWRHIEYGGQIFSADILSLPVKEAVLNQDERVEMTAITNYGGELVVANGEKSFRHSGYFVSKEFLQMFDFDLIQGQPSSVFNKLESAVISASLASALFGDVEALGQTIKIDNGLDVEVTGILADLPANSSFDFEILMPFDLMVSRDQEWFESLQNNWINNSFHIYTLLKDPEDLASVNASIKDMADDYYKAAGPVDPDLFLYPMSQWRLHSGFENGEVSGGIIEYVRLFSVIAILVLIIACVNFMNLATARSERRAKEVGIRKSLGSGKKQLISQFLSESIFVTTVAFLFAILIVEISLPFYNQLLDKSLYVNYLAPSFWITGIALILLVGFISGSYPAFFLSSFKPVKVLKGMISTGKKGIAPRKVLVISQFAFSIMLIVGTVVIFKQIKHVKSRDLGYNQDNLITVPLSAEINENYESIVNRLKQNGSVESVTRSNSEVTQKFSSNLLEWEGMPEGVIIEALTITTDYDYLETTGAQLLVGRDFSRNFNDTACVILNQAAVDTMNVEDPIDMTIRTAEMDLRVVGVMNDMLIGSPYDPKEPMTLIFFPEWLEVMTIKLSSNLPLTESIAEVESVLSEMNPAYPFEYEFVDESFERKFTTINLINRLSSLFAFLAIFVTSLGLLGLAAFTAERRTKEVGIRKVLGATIVNVMVLISKDFTRLVGFAFLFAAPISWYVLESFLSQYNYRIDMPLWVLPVAGLSTLLIAILIVCSQAFKAAIMNPVNSLRNE